jgi:glycosyltransferase involved in cell wall biosynthesis
MNPISVILPVYNGQPYLKQSVQSVLDQSLQDFELLIIDDCSTDPGCWEYLSGLQDPRIRLSRNPVNKGLFPNLNALVLASGAPLIKLWSQDDVMHPNCLAETINFHRRYPEIGFSYSARETIDESGEIIQSAKSDITPELVDRELHSRISFFTGSIAGNIANVTIVRTALDKIGLFREDMRISGDFDMWVRLAQYYPVGFLQQPLIQLRDHAGQLSRQEKYYIFHLKEDIRVYNYLLDYVSKTMRAEGRYLLRNYKLMFYYTLMVKAFLKGRWATGAAFFQRLSRFDNIFLLTAAFVRNRILRKTGFPAHLIFKQALATDQP